MYKNLTVREMYASCVTKVVDEFFRKGLEVNNDRIAIPALKELIRRGDIDLVVDSLNYAFNQGQIIEGSCLILPIGGTLFNDTREIDPILYRYSQGLLRGELMGPSKWVRAHAEQFRNVYRSGMVKNARPWAATQIWADDKDAE